MIHLYKEKIFYSELVGHDSIDIIIHIHAYGCLKACNLSRTEAKFKTKDLLLLSSKASF